jgi:hypothetical protein
LSSRLGILRELPHSAWNREGVLACCYRMQPAGVTDLLDAWCGTEARLVLLTLGNARSTGPGRIACQKCRALGCIDYVCAGRQLCITARSTAYYVQLTEAGQEPTKKPAGWSHDEYGEGHSNHISLPSHGRVSITTCVRTIVIVFRLCDPNHRKGLSSKGLDCDGRYCAIRRLVLHMHMHMQSKQSRPA